MSNKTINGIPKIIHQVWINDSWKDSSLKKDVPEKYIKSQKEWQRIHPDWEYILWTDELVLSYLEQYHPDYIDFYKSYEYLIQRADMIRYFFLYDFGGVYSDLDLYPQKNIETYISGPIDHFTYEANLNVYVNALMISPGHTNLMKELYENLKNVELPWFCVGKHLKVMFSTGPNYLYNRLLLSTYPYVILPRKLF